MAELGDRWPLVGRDDEMALLDEELGRRGGCVVVAGPIGVGKSQLLASWSAAWAAGEGTAVSVRATRSTATIPFGAFAGWVQAQPAGPAGSGDRLAVLQAIAARLAAAGREAVVVVDDAHLLDDGSAALVLHLVQHTSLRVLVAVRRDEPCPDAVVAVWKEGLGQQVDLPPLTERRTVELLERVLDGPVDVRANRRVWQLTQGNPLYLRELVDAARAQGVLVRTERGWQWQGALSGPTRLVELVRDRLDRRGSPERRALETLALGEPLPIEVLGALATDAAVADLEERGLVVVEPPSAGNPGLLVRLAHPLYAEVLRGELPARRASAVCSALAQAAVEAGMGRHDPVRVATWLLDGGGPPQQPELLVEAARRTRFVDDYELSVRFSEAAERAGGGWRATLLRAIALGPLGRLDEAEALLTSLSASAREPAARVAAAHVLAEQAFWYRGRDLSDVLTILTQAAETVPAPDRSQLLGYGAELALAELQLDESIRLATRAYNDAGSLRDRLHAVVSAGLAAVARGRTGAAGAAVRLALPGAVQVIEEDPLPALYVALLHSYASVLDGQIDQAATFFEQTVGPWRDRDPGVAKALTIYWAGRAALEQGRVGTAARVCGEALAMFGDVDHYGRGTWMATTLALAAAQAGDAETAASAVVWIDAHPRTRVQSDELFAELARAWLSAARGELPAAGATARAAAERAREAGVWMIETKALLHAARLGAAAAVAPRLEELTGIVEGPYVGAAARFARAVAEGDAETLDEVAERFAGMGARLHAAEAAAVAAEAHGAAGRRWHQATSWAVAAEHAARCEGAATPLLARLGPDPTLTLLTGREREVVELAARRLTNRQIADRLGVSVRTVHSHLNHAYAKLGTADRNDLAALVHLTGVPDR